MTDETKFNEKQYIENMFDACFELCCRACRWSEAEGNDWLKTIGYNFKHGKIKDHDRLTKLKLANWFLVQHAVRHGYFLGCEQRVTEPSGWVV